MNLKSRILGAALLAGAAATSAFAGGPNYMFDEVNRVPYRWHLDRYPNNAVPVYIDLGGLGLLNNQQATAWTVQALDQWNNVATSSYKTQVMGDVSLLGLGDITPANVNQIYPNKFNRGGITVVFDYDGKIFRDYLGLGQNQILGISYMEFMDDDTDEILENTVFINGFMQWFNDTDGSYLAGAITHEVGHSANLSHTQANGAVYNAAVRDYPWPYGCPSGPHAGGENSGPSREQIETMYPFLDNRITGTAKGQFTVDKMEDIAAISDLYPEAGWPENYGTIKGTIKSLTKILGNGTGPEKQVTGVNVIARNVADPYNDFNSAVSGGLTRGYSGDDGSFEIHGLTPGAQYVIYTDNLAAGAFFYPRMIALPGPEEWYNGASESGNGETDNRCAWTPITVQDHSTNVADITFNRVKGAPSITYMDFNGSPYSMSADGSTMVGANSSRVSYWLWSETDGYREIGGVAPIGGLAVISADGSKVAGNARDADGVVKWGLWDRATDTWQIVPTPTGGRCTQPVVNLGNTTSTGTVWGLSGDGKTIVGSTYNDGPNSCRASLATKWSEAGGAQLLQKYPNVTNNPGSRAAWANYDGSVISGYDLTPRRDGVYWLNGVEHFMGTINIGVPYVDQSGFVTPDGSSVLGVGGYSSQQPTFGAYKHYTTNDSREVIGVAPVNGSATSWRSNEAGTVISGFWRLGSQSNGQIWTAGIGWSDLQLFLNAQGIYAPGTVFGWPQALSADGTIWAGSSATALFGTVPWRIEIPKAIVCHKSAGNPNAKAKNLDVAFPGGLDEHLAHGDTIGLCQHGGE